MRKLPVLLVLLALAGCYNPRYPDEGPGHDRPDQAAVGSSATGEPVTDSSGKPVQSRSR